MLKSMKMNWTMSLMICCCLAVTVGCNPVDNKEYLDLTEKTQLGAYISLAVVSSTPEPDGGGGKLNVGDECPDCLGRGMVGDGTIENKCNRCNGTGKVQPGDPDVASMSSDNGKTWMTNAEVTEWMDETWEDELAQSSLTPQQIADIRSAIKRWIQDTAQSVIDDRPVPSPPPKFAPTQEDIEGGNVLPQSPNPGASGAMPEDEVIRSPKAPSQKRCLCGPECGCGGDCDPCNCIYCGLPESGPGPLLSEQPLIATYVFKDGAIYVKDGEELKPLE
jgi:hypothetical protein